MSKLTKAAKGQTCTIQLYPYCNEDPETVVFCHMNSEDKGMGIKSPDFWGADGCSACHDIVDRRKVVEDIFWDEIDKAFTRGVYRTIKRRIEQRLIEIK